MCDFKIISLEKQMVFCGDVKKKLAIVRGKKTSYLEKDNCKFLIKGSIMHKNGILNI